MFKTLFAFLLAAMVFAAGPAFSDTTKTARLLSLSGHGEVKAAPDMAIVELGVLSQGTTAKAALDANTKNMVALLAALKANGIDDKDVQTSNFSVGPRYENNPNASPTPKIAGYDVNNAVAVTVHKLSELGGILDKAVTAGSNQINNVSFGIAEAQQLQDDARKAAVKDAVRKALVLTAAAGTKLGAIVSLSENGAMPLMPLQARTMAADTMAAKAAPVPMAQGEMTIGADVNVVWEME